jgi:anti-anti-sigma regulatory factor
MSARDRSEYLEFGPVNVIRPGAKFDSLYESDLDDAGISLEVAAKLPTPLLVIDLKNVKFIGSAFLGRCVQIRKYLDGRPGGRFAICGLNTFARAAVTVAALDKVLDVYENCDEAVGALGGN